MLKVYGCIHQERVTPTSLDLPTFTSKKEANNMVFSELVKLYVVKFRNVGKKSNEITNL